MSKIVSIIWIAIAGAALALGGCSYVKAFEAFKTTTVTTDQLNTARQTVLALRNGYNLGVVILAKWVEQPRCASPATVSPLCTTRNGVIAVAKAQQETGQALMRVEAIVVEAQPDASALTVAMDAAKAAYATFQSVQTTYGGK